MEKAMSLERTRPRLTRRVLVISGAGLLAAAGAGSYIATHAAAASPASVNVAAPVNPAAPNSPEPASNAPDADNVQDSTGADPSPAAGNAAAAETEKPGAESEAASDGPGGFADTSPTADTQQQGEN